MKRKSISLFSYFNQCEMNTKEKIRIKGGNTPPSPSNGSGNDNSGTASTGGGVPTDSSSEVPKDKM